MPSPNNRRESYIQSDMNTSNNLLKRQYDGYGGEGSSSTTSLDPVISPTQASSNDSFKHDSRVNQGIVSFILIVGILMGITITTGLIIYTYIYRKKLICKRGPSSNSNNKAMMIYNYHNENDQNDQRNHSGYDDQKNLNDYEERGEDGYERNRVIDTPGSDIMKEKKIIDDASVSRSNTAKTNKSYKSTGSKTLGNKISLPQFSSPSVSVYDNERAKSLTWNEKNHFQITRTPPPVPYDETMTPTKPPTIIVRNDSTHSMPPIPLQYKNSITTKNSSDPRPTKPQSLTIPSSSDSPSSSPSLNSRSYNRESDIYSIYNYYSLSRSSEIKGSVHPPEARLTNQNLGVHVEDSFSDQPVLNLEPIHDVSEPQVNNKETKQGEPVLPLKDFGEYYPEESGPNYTTTYYL